jgi:hypothetical protein
MKHSSSFILIHIQEIASQDVRVIYLIDGKIISLTC